MSKPETISEYFDRKKLSNVDVASRCSLSEPTVRNLRAGKPASYATIRKLSEGLGISRMYVMRLVDATESVSDE